MAAPDKLQLVSAQVTNFGCFRDSGVVPIDDVTALIAENENGKTTFLRALAWWSDHGAPFDEEDRWEGAPVDELLPLVALTFDVPRTVAQVLRAGGVLKVPDRIKVIRDTKSTYSVLGLPFNAAIDLTPEPAAYGDERTALVEWITTPPFAGVVPGEFIAQLNALTPDNDALSGVLDAVHVHLAPHFGPPHQPEWEQLRAALVAAQADAGRSDDDRLLDLLEPHLPTLVYFDDQVDFVRDAAPYAEVASDPQTWRTMINLAKLAGVDLQNIASQGPHERLNFSKRAERKFSASFTEYWEDDEVTVQVQLDESQMTLLIENKGRTQRPSRRSSGLKWHLGFFTNFMAEVEGDLSGAVLLLDEPGLKLHIKQQPMLLKLFEKLSGAGCKIIYSTHLSHMLPPDKPHTFRPLVVDKTTPGATCVVANIAALGSGSKLDVLRPVRQALGLGIADALGLGGRNVIAEGLSERYVLLTMSEVCAAADRPALSSTTTVLPAGGSGKKLLPFAAMAIAEKSKAVILVDDDGGGRSTVNEITKVHFQDVVPVIRTHEEEEPTGLELEDLISRELFVQLVNDSHASVAGYTPLGVTDLDPNKPICDAVGAAFADRGLGKFQKLRVALELQRWHEVGGKVDDDTVNAFAQLFERINKALRAA